MKNWQSMQTAPRDGTVIEIENHYGTQSWYGLFKWASSIAVPVETSLSDGTVIESGFGEIRVEPQWVDVIHPGHSIEDDSYCRWRPYNGIISEYVDLTGAGRRDEANSDPGREEADRGMSERTMRERLAWAVDDSAMFLAEEAEEDGDQEKASDHRRDVYRKVDAILAELREPDATTTEILAVYLGANERDEQALACARSGWRAAIDVIRGEGQDAV